MACGPLTARVKAFLSTCSIKGKLSYKRQAEFQLDIVPHVEMSRFFEDVNVLFPRKHSVQTQEKCGVALGVIL